MSRIEELQRQRALIAAHLAWLDSELTRLHGGPALEKDGRSSAPFPPPPELPDIKARTRTPPPFPLPQSSLSDADTTQAQKLVENYQQEAANSATLARRGCLLTFVGGLLVLGLGFALVYFFKYWK